jgi:transglutaminase-like putative cysteine protease
MRFGLAHKTATYLMVMAAFVAMVGGGGVSPLIALLGFVGLVVSWWWEPPLVRYEKWALAWTLASLVVLAYAVLSAIATGDYLGVGGEFLIWLTVTKAFNRRTARDWQQLYLLTFLMLVAGSVLNADLNYGIAFLVFVVASTWAVTLFHLRREMEDNFLLKHADDRASERVEVRRILASRRIVDRRFFIGTGAISLAVFVGSAVFFLAMPRLGMGFFFKSKPGLSMAGFSERVKLGGHGAIKNDSTVLMRVEIPEQFGGKRAPLIHWRGVGLDHYEGGEWSRSPNAPLSEYAPVPGGSRTLELRVFDRDWERGVRQEIYLEPLDTQVLFGASRPLAFRVPWVRNQNRGKERNDEIRLPHGSETLHYTVYSELDPPPADALRAARGDLPIGYDVYLQLPCEDPEAPCPDDFRISERTRELAAQITAPFDNDYDRANAIVAYLQSTMTYTLELAEAPTGQEPIDFYVFDRKKGHCEVFASAFAVLARSAGIPTRNVNGFLGGEWNDYYVAVRAGDAHAWNEVWFPRWGWVTFDPTPAGQVDRLGRGGTGVLARIRRFFDRIRFQWSKWVIEYDLQRQLGLFKGIGQSLKAAGRAVRAFAIEVGSQAKKRWYLLVLVGLMLAALIQRRRKRIAAMLGAHDRARRRRPVAEIWTGVITRLARRGLPRDPALTPRELARRWTAPGSAELAELTELYYAVEYGGADEAAAVGRARALRDRIVDLVQKPAPG